MKLKALFSAKLAGNIMLYGLLFLALFHVLVLLKVLPSNIVWGGRVADSESNMFATELMALIITLLCMGLVVIRLNYLRKGKLKIVSSIGMWVIFVLFAVSTVGNLQANAAAEKLIFTPLSIILALLALRLAAEKYQSKIIKNS